MNTLLKLALVLTTIFGGAIFRIQVAQATDDVTANLHLACGQSGGVYYLDVRIDATAPISGTAGVVLNSTGETSSISFQNQTSSGTNFVREANGTWSVTYTGGLSVQVSPTTATQSCTGDQEATATPVPTNTPVPVGPTNTSVPTNPTNTPVSTSASTCDRTMVSAKAVTGDLTSISVTNNNSVSCDIGFGVYNTMGHANLQEGPQQLIGVVWQIVPGHTSVELRVSYTTACNVQRDVVAITPGQFESPYFPQTLTNTNQGAQFGVLAYSDTVGTRECAVTTSTPTPTIVVPTNTPKPSATPTKTSVLPTRVPTPKPTSTLAPLPTPKPTHTPVPTATITIPGVCGPCTTTELRSAYNSLVNVYNLLGKGTVTHKDAKARVKLLKVLRHLQKCLNVKQRKEIRKIK